MRRRAALRVSADPSPLWADCGRAAFSQQDAEADFKTVAYLGTGVTSQPRQEPYLAVTYSSEWVERYRAQRYVEIDPVVQVGMRRVLPIDWADFGSANGKVRSFFGEAAEFGLGRKGLSIPIHGRHGARALFSITSDLNDRDCRSLRQHYMRDFQVLALHMHEVILRLEGHETEPPALSPRERECLQWIAEGQDRMGMLRHPWALDAHGPLLPRERPAQVGCDKQHACRCKSRQG